MAIPNFADIAKPANDVSSILPPTKAAGRWKAAAFVAVAAGATT